MHFPGDGLSSPPNSLNTQVRVCQQQPNEALLEHGHTRWGVESLTRHWPAKLKSGLCKKKKKMATASNEQTEARPGLLKVIWSVGDGVGFQGQ